jgi:hypothetical protein
MRLKLVGILTIMILSETVSAKCLAPVEFAKDFYSKNRSFYADDPLLVESFLTHNFLTAAKNNWACAVKNEGLCIGFDPWVQSQDLESIPPVFVQSVLINTNTAKVKFVFEYEGFPDGKPYTVSDYLILKSDNESCWKLDDLIMNDGKSLSKLFSSQSQL